jgi:hypothetical protein
MPSPFEHRQVILTCYVTDDVSFYVASQYLDQLSSSTSESCAGIPQQLTANRSSSKEIKAERLETQASAFKNEVSRARCNRAAAANLKSKGCNWSPYSFM